MCGGGPLGFLLQALPQGRIVRRKGAVGLTASCKDRVLAVEFDLAAGLPADRVRDFTALPWKSPELDLALGVASKRDRRFWRLMDSTTGGALYPPAPCIPQ